jgi:hypothetical protein
MAHRGMYSAFEKRASTLMHGDMNHPMARLLAFTALLFFLGAKRTSKQEEHSTEICSLELRPIADADIASKSSVTIFFLSLRICIVNN